ncbi:MAG: ketoacyl-ACP synthase III [Holophagaceae bacterium]|nr:ketoacyl-ACP synthase III [Holophagaceae bacterium]
MAHLLGFGAYLPGGVLDNAALAEEFGVEPSWILNACGIETRRIAAPEESVVDLAEQAARNCLADAGLAPSDLGGIIVGSGTPHRQFPGISASLQQRLEVNGIPAFDIHLASVGGFFALATAAELCHRYGPILVVGAERMSEIMLRQPRVKETAILFGDGAGACIVAPGEGPITVVDVRMQSDGTFADELSLEFEAALAMNGRTVILQANRKLRQSLSELLDRNGLKVPDVGLWLFHQANVNLLKQIGLALQIPEDRVYLNLARYGNTSSAALLIATAEAKAEGRLNPGFTVMAAFGAGMGWGSALLRIT